MSGTLPLPLPLNLSITLALPLTLTLSITLALPLTLSRCCSFEWSCTGNGWCGLKNESLSHLKKMGDDNVPVTVVTEGLDEKEPSGFNNCVSLTTSATDDWCSITCATSDCPKTICKCAGCPKS